MRTPAPADSLRAARALLKLSQREVAAGARTTPRSVSAAETDETVFLETNLQLVDFFVGQGIEFMGETAIGKEVVRAGARFAAPRDRDVGVPVKRSFQAIDFAVPFRAARALLHREQAEVAQAVGLTVAVVQNLERGKKSPEPHELLRSWYETNGVEFTGWADIATGRFYGVGVRWAT
ncbi:Hypothetical protein NGAL_HAMBI1146_00450 [Neorhizobium galegae bv. officinalis]|nr:Hypothetical protein NGAL_HAMBI1146_00450 [Neorhizobium galegae bv. officinalis]